MANPIRILAFSGSARRESLNRKLLAVTVQAVREAGGEVTLLDLNEVPLPLYHGDLEDAEGLPANAVKIIDLNYHLQNSHVLPALIRKFHEAKAAGRSEVTAWGSGAPRREFLHVDDLADACAFLLRQDKPPDWINVGTGTDVTIRELTETVAAVTGFTGRIVWDATKPDGSPRKLMDVSRLTALGWRAHTGLRDGVAKTYASFLAEKAAGTLRN